MIVNMNDVLLPAKQGHYGVGFFNAVTEEMAHAVIDTAEELNSPVMIGTAEVLLPRMSMENVLSYLVPMAENAKVPVCIHFDHALTYDNCIKSMNLGFTSVMYDRSTASYEENVSDVAKMAEHAHQLGFTIEGELGHVGDNDGEGALSNPSDFYTDPDVAIDFVTRTKVDSLAVAVGNAHGAYKFPPKLDFNRIRTIAELTGIPLVLHGGSGLADDDFRQAVKEGICKINIFTDIDNAAKDGLDAMKCVVRNKLSLFGSVNKV